MWKGLGDMGSNNNFGNAFIQGVVSAFNPVAGAVLIGRDVARKYMDYKEKQSWEDAVLSKLENAIDSEQYVDAVKMANEILDNPDVGEDTQRIAKWCKAISYSCHADELADDRFSLDDKENKDALDVLQQAKDLFFEYGNEYGWDDDVVFQLMIIDNQLDMLVLPRNYAIYLLNSENNEYRKRAIDIYTEDTECLLQGSFTDVPYDQRKYVYIGQSINKIGGTYQLFDDCRAIDWIFTIDQLPPDMVFPLGRPQPGLFMAHPVLTDHYYPMKGVEEALFMDKVREFCWFVQCLGAKMVSFHSNKGLSVSEGMGSTMNIGTNVGVKAVEVGASYGNTSNRNEDYNYNQKVELVQHFSPIKKPYCPDDLVWFDSDPAWQMLLKQRIEGGIMEYNYKISSNETCQMTSNEKNEVKTNFGYMMVKVNADFDMSTDQTFSSNEETEWSIHVEFAPLEELTEEPNKTKSDNNQNETTMNDYEKMDGGMSLNEHERKEYSSRMNSPFSMEIRDVWELEKYPHKPMVLGRVWSGIIDIEKDNKVVIVNDHNTYEATVFGTVMFNKLIGYAEAGDACGIMLQGVDADDLQVGSIIYKASEYSNAKGQNEITDAEQEYLDTVRECLEDGEIGMRERKLLDKIRVNKGISEKRAQELEASLSVPKLTDDEKEYLEAFKDACEDGKVSDKQRRLLEKLRVMYGISEERAKEIEDY